MTDFPQFKKSSLYKDVETSENKKFPHLDGAVAEKRAYNAKRSDHKIENRVKDNGKKF